MIKSNDTISGQTLAESRGTTTLPPTTEAFQENVKRAHFQAVQWYAAPYSSAEQLDSEKFGWIRDEKRNSLIPVRIPSKVPAAPQQILEMIKCYCRSDKLQIDVAAS